jgi:hypothetical protein
MFAIDGSRRGEFRASSAASLKLLDGVALELESRSIIRS